MCIQWEKTNTNRFNLYSFKLAIDKWKQIWLDWNWRIKIRNYIILRNSACYFFRIDIKLFHGINIGIKKYLYWKLSAFNPGEIADYY